MKNSNKNNIAYVKINDHISFRKHILLSSIDIIKILEKYENIKQIRNEKRKILVELKEKIVDLNNDALLIKELLPGVNKHELKREAREVEEKIEKVKYPKKSEGYRHLQHELNELQDKLNKLNI